MNWFARFFAVVFLISLSGCFPLLLGAGATGVVVVTSQDRSIGKIVDDNTIWVKLKSKYEFDPKFTNIYVSVNEGRVLLTGNVKSSLDRMNASKIAWDTLGVKEVMNEIQIALHEEHFAQSSWITAQAKLLLFTKAHVKSANYSIETYDGIVYLMGIAQNKDELKRVIDTIQNIPNVVKIVSYVRLKNSDLRK